MNYQNGMAAEECVSRHYQDLGYPLCASRWRGDGGELDLVFSNGDGFIMVEVKSAATHDQARHRFRARQLHRVSQTAQQFAADCPAGLDTEMRIDLALVDAMGRVAIIENVTLH